MNFDVVKQFEGVRSKISGMYEEMGLLSRKNPDGAINLFKLKFVNDAIRAANGFLTKDGLPLDGFSEFDLEDILTASDVVFVLAQYLRGFDSFVMNNAKVKFVDSYYWEIDGTGDEIDTYLSFRKGSK